MSIEKTSLTHIPDFIGNIYRSISQSKGFLESYGSISYSDNYKVMEVLKFAEFSFEKVFHQAPFGICIISANGEILEVNNAFCQIVGYTLQELRKIPLDKLTHPDDYSANINYVNKILSGEIDDFSIEKRYLCKDGSHAWVSMEAYAVRDDNNNLLHSIVMVRDITDLHEANEKMREKERLATLGEMSAFLTHEIKSPLSILKMNFQLLEEELTNEKLSKETFRIINKEVKRMENLLSDVLYYSNQKKSESIAFNIRKKIEVIGSSLKPKFISHKINFFNYVDDISIKADAQKMHTLFLHLIENSIDAIKSDGEIKLYSETDVNNNSVSIFIQDTGCGFIHTEKAFEPFFTTKSSGTGLGLAIAQKIITQCGGTISIASSAPGRTIIKINFPF